MSLFSFPAQVNEKAARLVATGVVLASVTALVFELPWIVPVLFAGFLLRVGWGPKFSPLARTAMALASRLGVPKPVTGAPKRFAQGVGAVFTGVATALLFFGPATAGWWLVGILVVFASLEAGLAFCMGCWVYGRLQAVGVFPPDLCVDCAPRRSVEPA